MRESLGPITDEPTCLTCDDCTVVIDKDSEGVERIWAKCPRVCCCFTNLIGVRQLCDAGRLDLLEEDRNAKPS